MSHLRILEDAILGGLHCIGVFEDDIVLVDDFPQRLAEALQRVPDDWEMLYLGGQHRKQPTTTKVPGIVRCTDCHRTHSYLVRGESLGKLYRIWSSNTGHVDHILRNTGSFASLKAYAVEPWLTGQRESKSDINGRDNAERWWELRKSASRRECGGCKAAHNRRMLEQAKKAGFQT